MNPYNDIALAAVNELNTRILNRSFTKLQENDEQLFPINNYFPNIWENKWFNGPVAGYDAGYVVWKYTMTSSDFLNQFGNLVYNYAQGNEKLRNYLTQPWDDIISKNPETSAYWALKYENVITGYSEVVSSYYDEQKKEYVNVSKQLFDQLFDYGPKKSHGSNERIQIFISTKDNNKDQLSNTASWKNVVISSQTAFDEYVETELSIMFDEHLANYHFGGLSTMQDVDDNFITKDLSNFNIDEVFNCPRMTSHNTYVNSFGFDYVIDFHKKEYSISIRNKDYKYYKFFRLWNSGYLEHFGTVPCELTHSTDISDYYVTVELNWSYDSKDRKQKTAPIYDYDQDIRFYDSRFTNLNYATGKQEDASNISGVTKYGRYNIVVTPMLFHEDDYYFYSYSQTNQFDDSVSNVSSYSYPNDPLDNIASSYVTVELHHMANDHFCFTKSNTNDLLLDDIVQFYSYYTSGYKIIYEHDYQLANTIVYGISAAYSYTGQPIRPNISVYTKSGAFLSAGIDYDISYADNIARGTATIGISQHLDSKYRGYKVVHFDIV